MGLKVGDEVLVTKPRNLEDAPSWVSAMDKYDGTIQVVMEADGRWVNLLGCNGWDFNSDWLTLVLKPINQQEGTLKKMATTIENELKEIALSEDDKSLYESGIANLDGSPTYEGEKLIWRAILEQTKPQLVEKAKAILAHRASKKK